MQLSKGVDNFVIFLVLSSLARLSARLSASARPLLPALGTSGFLGVCRGAMGGIHLGYLVSLIKGLLLMALFDACLDRLMSCGSLP